MEEQIKKQCNLIARLFKLHLVRKGFPNVPVLVSGQDDKKTYPCLYMEQVSMKPQTISDGYFFLPGDIKVSKRFYEISHRLHAFSEDDQFIPQELINTIRSIKKDQNFVFDEKREEDRIFAAPLDYIQSWTLQGIFGEIHNSTIRDEDNRFLQQTFVDYRMHGYIFDKDKVATQFWNPGQLNDPDFVKMRIRK